jgi:hypothetical protein
MNHTKNDWDVGLMIGTNNADPNDATGNASSLYAGPTIPIVPLS